MLGWILLYASFCNYESIKLGKLVGLRRITSQTSLCAHTHVHTHTPRKGELTNVLLELCKVKGMTAQPSLANRGQADSFTRPCRHFLFKTSSGSTPLFSSSSPGYPLTSGTVYTPPPRLLPRNTFSRKAFKLKKPSKYCSWKCAALSAIAAALLLAILLAYFIGKSKQPCSPSWW